jgi:glycosyltransferase involved in cell wall biosynthesis
MRIVIDLQGAQNNSRNRGIGRYSLSLAKAIARVSKDSHEIVILLNGAFSDSIYDVCNEFEGLVPKDNIKIFHGLRKTDGINPDNNWRRVASEHIYEHYIRLLCPDFLLVTSLIEGFEDETIISIGKCSTEFQTAVILYDLIPLIYPGNYLQHPHVSFWYYNRLDELRRANLLLSISESSRNEAINYLGFPVNDVVNISGATDDNFKVIPYSNTEKENLLSRYGISKPFVLYAGASDQRKNIEGLIVAYGSLSKTVLASYQLVIAWDFSGPSRKQLIDLALDNCMSSNDLIFTGYVPDRDLVALYNTCSLFVFPSFHEGFGLPALEAMSCGAPTIASRATSLPEVVGWDSALFDPNDTLDISRLIEKSLTDKVFREGLLENALLQSKKFCWDKSAEIALNAMEVAYNKRMANQSCRITISHSTRKRLAYVSPISVSSCKVSKFGADLLPELSRYYAIDIILEQEDAVTDPWILANCNQRSTAWFEQHVIAYDRIIYNFGNSSYHQHMFALLERYPGVVILHDFFLGGVLWQMDMSGFAPSALASALQRSHGWSALAEFNEVEDVTVILDKYPSNLNVLQRALGIVSHYSFPRGLAIEWYGTEVANNWFIIPQLLTPVVDIPHDQARIDLNFNNDSFLVCYFGQLGERALTHLIIDAWQSSLLADDARCKLYFVGELPEDPYGRRIRQMVHNSKGRIHVTGKVDDKTYHRYLAAADLSIQLSNDIRGEVLSSILDCMNYGIPTITNGDIVTKEFPNDVIYNLSDVTIMTLRNALELFRSQPDYRKSMGHCAAAYVRTLHQPRSCADQYARVIEMFYEKADQGLSGIANQLQNIGFPANQADLVTLAERISDLYPPSRPVWYQLLIDVSELVHRDAKSGIQRVVRRVLQELLENPPYGYRVEPVYATFDHGYRYARSFTAQFLTQRNMPLDDDPISAAVGDIFWGLDLQPLVVPHHKVVLNELRNKGIKVYFTLYDILPVTEMQTTDGDVREVFTQWMLAILYAGDGVLCISKTVASNFKQWLDLFAPQNSHSVRLGWAHLGADVMDDNVELRSQSDSLPAVNLVGLDPGGATFLMVGTVEPRKGYAQVLSAFELLWNLGENANLVIVGKKGWNVEELMILLATHPERDRRLFWLQDVDDALLERLYSVGTCLIAASLDEGFGLPLIEAARHNLPIIARDIPVFREVAGDHTSYFSGLAPQDLAGAVLQWLARNNADAAPQSTVMPWLTWAESTKQMLGVILDEQWQDQWVPVQDAELVARYWGSDYRVHSKVGQCMGTALWSTGHAGPLAYGPAGLSLKAGHYLATWSGSIGLGECDDGAHVDVSFELGTKLLARASLNGLARGDGHFTVTLPFTLKEDRADVEVRVWVGERSDVRLDLLEIRKASLFAILDIDNHDKSPKPAGVLTEKPSPSVQIHRYWATHPKMNTEVGYRMGRSVHATGKKGYLLFGPHVGLPKGQYVATLLGVVPETGGLVDGCYMEVAWDRGRDVANRQTLHATQADSDCVLGRVTFELTAYIPDLEIRVYVVSGVSLRLDGIAIEQIL